MTEAAIPEPSPEQAAIFARVRRMMLIAGATTGIAVAAVLFAVGYRLFKSEGSAATAAADVTAALPKGARIVSTGVAGERVVVTLDIGGTTRDPHLRCEVAETGRDAEIRQRTLRFVVASGGIPSLPGLTRQSIVFARRWMPGSSPGMATIRLAGSPFHGYFL